MKKITLILGLILMTINHIHAKDYLGVQVGYANPITRLNVGDNKNTLFPTSYHGMKIGFVYDATLWKGLGVSMGLNYTFGANVTDWTKKVSTQQGLYPQVRSRGQYHQLEIPVDWQYKIEIAKKTWFIVYPGPTLQCGLSFKQHTNTQLSPNSSISSELKDRYATPNAFALKHLNVTWGVGAGFQYQRYFLRGGYDFGIMNPYKAQVFEGFDIYTRGRFDQWQIKLGMYLYNW